MAHLDTEHLRVLIANERKDRLALVAPLVALVDGHRLLPKQLPGQGARKVARRCRAASG
jgi:response regulator NasT